MQTIMKDPFKFYIMMLIMFVLIMYISHYAMVNRLIS